MSVDGASVPELVDDVVQFLRRYYHEAVLDLAEGYPRDRISLTVDWQDLYQFDPSLADDVLDDPERIKATLEEALSTYDLPVATELGGAHVWLTGLPEASIYDVGGYRHEHINRLIGIRGVVSKSTDVEPQPVEIAFDCQRCGAQRIVPQSGSDIQEPHECQGCERQGPFQSNLEDSTFRDHRLIRVQAPPDKADGADASLIDVHVEHDLVECVQPGDRVIVSTVLRAEERDSDRTFRLYGDAAGIDILETDFEDVDVSAEDEERIKGVASDEPFQRLVDSVCPSLYGYEHVKEAILLQMFGGQTKDPGDGSRERGQSHIALIGDPSTGKSTLLDYAADLAPRSVRSAGKTSSAAGITAAAVRDDFGPGGEWTLEGGAIVKADKGLAAIDELDSMDQEDREALNEALEHQRVSVSKAGINATLNARTTLLAAANPIEGRFDEYQPIAGQIDLDPTLLSRFDLLFTFTDDVEEDQDRRIIEHKTTVWRLGAERANGHDDPGDAEDVAPDLEPAFIRKWIAYAKEHCHPVPTPEAIALVEERFQALRQLNQELGENDLDEENRPIPVTFRKQEAIHRLAEASARVRLSDSVEEQDVKRALRLIQRSLEDVGQDADGRFDADVIETGISMSQQHRRTLLRDVIQELAAESERPGAAVDEVFDVMDGEGVDPASVRNDLYGQNGLVKTGRVYEPADDRVEWYD